MNPQKIACGILDEVWRGDPSRWAKHRVAQNERGEVVPVTSASAVGWCVLGAMYWVAYASSSVGLECEAFLDELCGVLGLTVDKLARWQDAPERTFEEVVAAVEKVARRT